MIKVGRPRKHGIKNGAELIRAAEVFYWYSKKRAEGLKYSCAITDVVAEMSKKYPLVPISRSTVKRMIAMATSKEANAQWKITKQIDPISGQEITALGFEEYKPFERSSNIRSQLKNQKNN